MDRNIKIILIIIISITLFVGCNKREDVNHMSEKQLIKYVDDTIGEPIKYLRKDTSNEDQYVYTFLLTERDTNFDVYDGIYNNGINIDLAQFTDHYVRIIDLDYIKNIIDGLRYKRYELSVNYNINEEYDSNTSSYLIRLNNYLDIPNLSKYLVEIDKLYSFNIDKPKNLNLEEFNFELENVISFVDKSSITAKRFSFDNKSRLKYEEVYDYIVSEYIYELKRFDLIDETIPKKIWDKYDNK